MVPSFFKTAEYGLQSLLYWGLKNLRELNIDFPLILYRFLLNYFYGNYSFSDDDDNSLLNATLAGYSWITVVGQKTYRYIPCERTISGDICRSKWCSSWYCCRIFFATPGIYTISVASFILVVSRFFEPPRQTKIASKNRIVREIGDNLQRLTVE